MKSMKNLLLLLSALTVAAMLCGCSVSEMLSSLDSDKISSWLFSVTETELSPVKTAQEIKSALPEELADLTVSGTSMECEVTHLAIRSRNTDTTRRTDAVECEIELEGDGIEVHYVCTLNYTYTSSGGWGLVDWSVDSSELELDVSEGILTEQLGASCMEELEESLGEGSVSYQSTTWNKRTLVCDMVLSVDALSSCLQTQGDLTISAVLVPNLSDGLNFTWDITRNDSDILYGINAADTTWLVTGYVDTTAVQLAIAIADTDIQKQTVSLSAVVALRTEGSNTYTVHSKGSMTLSYTTGSDGRITFTFTLGGYSWDCCFDSDTQWARMDSSYIGSLSLAASSCLDSTELRALVDEDAIIDTSDALAYTTSTGGYTYTATDGTLVYELQVQYPQFSGSTASKLNSAINTAVKTFLGSPQLATSKSNLDALQEEAESAGVTLPYYSNLVISVVFNQNNYLSLLYSYTQKLEDGTVTYSYSSVTYDLLTMEKLDDSDVYSSGKTLGAAINAYASTARYSDAMVSSYIQTWTFSPSGLVFYVTKNESTGQCDAITVPYSESVCLIDPTNG